MGEEVDYIGADRYFLLVSSVCQSLRANNKVKARVKAVLDVNKPTPTHGV